MRSCHVSPLVGLDRLAGWPCWGWGRGSGPLKFPPPSLSGARAGMQAASAAGEVAREP